MTGNRITPIYTPLLTQNLMLIPNLKSEFRKNLKKAKKLKNTIFVPCFTTILIRIKKNIFFVLSTIELARKTNFGKKIVQKKPSLNASRVSTKKPIMLKIMKTQIYNTYSPCLKKNRPKEISLRPVLNQQNHIFEKLGKSMY